MTLTAIKVWRTLSFTLMILAVAVMAAASVATKLHSAEWYGSYTFFALWCLLGASATIYLYLRKIWHQPLTALLHLSLLVILVGAGITYFFAQRGTITLSNDSAATAFLSDGGTARPLSHPIQLKSFDIINYPGTDSPQNFIATADCDGKEYEISMNRRAEIDGYSLCLKNFANEEVTLSASQDKLGTAVSYTGYFLFMPSGLLMLLQPKGTFRRLLRTMNRLSAILLLLIPFNCLATPSAKEAEMFGKLMVENSGQLMLFESLSNSLITKIHGSPTIDGLSSEQVCLDLYLNSMDWGERKIVKIKDGKVREILGINGKYASYNDFITDLGEYKLRDALNPSQGMPSNAVRSADEQFQLLNSIMEGRLFRIFPVKDPKGNLVWYSPVGKLPAEVDGDLYAFIRGAFNLLTECQIKGDSKQFCYIVEKIGEYQRKEAGTALPSETRLRCEHFLNTANRLPFCFLALLFGLVGYLIWITDLRIKKTSGKILSLCCILLTQWLTAEFIIRWIAGNHIPLGNGPETMSFLAIAIGLVWLFVGRKLHLTPSAALLLMGFVLLVARMGRSNPPVTQLMPVLNSSLLSIHVLLVMLSYALLAMTCINSFTALITKKQQLEQTLTTSSRALLLPAIFLLGAGIFVGAMWANVSWGRYWGWDPKEVWALITLMLYALPLHSASLPLFNRNRFFNRYITLAFLSVIITYFGVNFFLGGMHSYA